MLDFFQKLHTTQGDGTTVHTVQTLDGHDQNMQVDLTEATLGQDGQLIITGEDGHGKKSFSVFFEVFSN